MVSTSTLQQPPPAERGVFCNRTLNLRAIRAIGYDMDYTLIHYKVDEWERRAYAYLQRKLEELGWPVSGLDYQPELTMRGLIIDRDLGNLVKADRFGYVKRACHGTRPLTFDEQKQTYARTTVDLADPRWIFLNTFFSLSEACLYAQLVDRLDAERFAVLGYAELYGMVNRSLDETHAEGRLKQEIIERPERYVDLDPEVPRTLLDQKDSGKSLLLITNSEWPYTQAMMRYCFDPFLPGDMTWQDLFELVIVLARKPEFFAHRNPAFEVVDDAGLMRSFTGRLDRGRVFVGGHAALVEEHLGLSGAEILFVGDHLYTDVRVSKDILRWRTALMVRELEEEITQQVASAEIQERLDALMRRKEALEFEQAQLRLVLQRRQHAGPTAGRAPSLSKPLNDLRRQMDRLDEQIGPLAGKLGELFNPIWGPLMRTGSDKSHLARQVESYADVYTSRVSNFLYQTPFAYLRSPRGSLPHDPGVHAAVTSDV